MTIAKDFASKLAVAFVASAMIFSLVAPAVNAQESTEDLQKTINDLLAQVAELQGKTGGSSATSCETIPPPLTVGSRGADVMELQERLMAWGESIPDGPTDYFGGQTQAALASWQAKNNVSPAAGYYGPITQAAMDAVCVEDGDEDEDGEDGDEDDEDVELSGEGTLEDLEVEDASDTEVQEGSEDAEIAELTLEADDGDIEVDRLTFVLDGTGNDEDFAADVFDTISLWVDGDMIAEFDASDEDEYLDEDDGEFRFTGLDLVVMEDEEVEVIVAASVVSSVDGSDGSGDADWNLAVTDIRYFDADGVAEDDEITSESADFSIVEAGDGEELKFGLGDNNPEATDIIVDEDDTTDGVTILEYTIEAEEGDIEINTLYVTVETSATTTNIVDDIYLVVDGEEFKDEGVTSNSAFTNTHTKKTYEFDIDGDVVIDEDEEVTVEVVVDFESQEGNYANGSTIEAYVNSDEREETDAEGMEDLDESSDFSGTAIGEEHTLVAEGIVVPVDGFTSEVDTLGQDDTIGEYTLEFEVTAVEGDFYITDNVSTSTSVTDGVRYTINPDASGAATASLESTGDEDSVGVFTVQEGETETFTLTVTFDPAAAGSFRVQLAEVWYSDATNGLGGDMYTPSPAQDFRSASQAIND
jgi:hypothetical protein